METQTYDSPLLRSVKLSRSTTKPLSVDTNRDTSFDEFCLTLSPLVADKSFPLSIFESSKSQTVLWAMDSNREIKPRKVVELDMDKSNFESVFPSVSIQLSNKEPMLPLKRPRKKLIFGSHLFMPELKKAEYK